MTTEDTDLTRVSHALDAVFLGNETINGESTDGVDLDREQYEAHLEEMPPAQKMIKLKGIFSEAKDFDIIYTLNKAGNNFGKAFDELLNQAYLEEQDLSGEARVLKKSIDAFTEPSINSRGRRGRKKKRQILRRTSSTPAAEVNGNATAEILPQQSRWERAKKDIEFIAQRTYIPPKTIASAYYGCGASLPSTIAAFCATTDPDIISSPYIFVEDKTYLEAHADDLSLDFPRVPYVQLTMLIKLTHPSLASAHELAQALSAQPRTNSTSKITPHYVSYRTSPERTSSSTAPPPNSSFPLSQSAVSALAAARSSAFTQAQAAYRKSKSKPLMGGAASYYSAQGRDASASLRHHEAATADALVASQSRPGEVDLHGVNVKDAVRISKARVEAWWAAEGREWARAGRVMAGGGLKLITGVGHHSAGGKAVLGPAVGHMLDKEGWRIRFGNGVVEVVGRQRR